ncbi:unnamed protein product [Rhizoctonia solani]|uniref:Zn(2)-C6 fungal-type domain-containing protein n=1 Tax=Rhizoctonia solani TaxID=456999 RepID=A0A8H3C4T0_9AGAM|nr:unnamed protein product [Rhizoctonia solani]
MPTFLPTQSNSVLFQLGIPHHYHLYYALLGVVGATGILALYKALSTKSDISMLDGPATSSVVWGSASDMFDDEGGLEFQDKLKNTYGSACRVQGPFGTTELWISDPRALQEILVKGYDAFKEPDWFTTWLELVFGPVVATVYGHQHKIQRKVWTSSLTPTMTIIGQKFVEILTSEIQTNGRNTEVVDIFKWVHLISLEVIGQAGIGHSFGILEGNVPDYLAASRDFFALMAEMWYFHPFITFFSRLGPASFRRAIVEWIPHRPVQRIKNVSDTMHKTAAEIMKHKREAMANGTLDSEVAAGKDIMTALLKQNLVVAPQDQMTDEEVLSQVNGLAFAGHDTTSSALSHAINLLAEHQEVQAKLQEEVHTAHRSYGKNLDYDQLNSLPYLDAVCRESLRVHAPGAFAIRVATKDWTLPLHYPVQTKDGKVSLTTIRVPKGTTLHVALRAANKDERTWGADAEEFKPDRWLEPLPESVSNARVPGIYSSMMTFLGGPRACPGMKFSQLEMKIVLSGLVSSFKFDPSEDKIKWKATGIAKPHIQQPDGRISENPMMPIRVTVLADTERKKCDEAEPKCLRCIKNGTECQYEYTQSGSNIRTKPAPRPAKERAKKLAKQQSNLASVSEPTDPQGDPDIPAGSFDFCTIPSLDTTLPLELDWAASLYELAMMPSLDTPIQSEIFPFVASQQLTTPQHFTPNQAGLLEALLSLGGSHLISQPDSLAPALPYSLPSIDVNLYSLHPLGSSSYSPVDLASDLHLSGDENAEDLEGVGKILCQTPVGLDRMVDSNSLVFVLCAYSEWIPLAVFDPLQIIHTSQETIANQFLESPASRCRLLLISELMRKLIKSRDLDDGGNRMLALLGGEIQRNITSYQIEQSPWSEEEQRRAIAALDHMVELLSIHVFSASLASTLRLLQLSTPVFLRAFRPPYPPHMSAALLNPSVNLRHFVVADVATSIATGRSLLCRYHVPWSLDLCNRFTKTREDEGLRWMSGIPDQFILLFGYMNGLKEDASTTGTPVDSRAIKQIEEDIRMIIIPPSKGRDASLAIGRMVVQECWREAVFIYMYMALCGANALDPRVMKAQKGFMKLVNGIKPGRNPDAFLVIPMMIAGVATIKSTHRQIITSRILTIPQFINPNTTGNDSLRMLEYIWARTKVEGRVARWEDLREACRRVTGI